MGIAWGILSQAFALYETNSTLAHICPLCQPPIKQTMRIISMLAETLIACIKSLGEIYILFLINVLAVIMSGALSCEKNR